MIRPRAADDFVAIRARLEELRRERKPRVRAAQRCVRRIVKGCLLGRGHACLKYHAQAPMPA